MPNQHKRRIYYSQEHKFLKYIHIFKLNWRLPNWILCSETIQQFLLIRVILYIVFIDNFHALLFIKGICEAKHIN